MNREVAFENQIRSIFAAIYAKAKFVYAKQDGEDWLVEVSWGDNYTQFIHRTESDDDGQFRFVNVSDPNIVVQFPMTDFPEDL